MEQTTKTAVQKEKGGKRVAGGSGRKPLRVPMIVLAVLIAAYTGLCVYAGQSPTIYPGVTVEGHPIGGLTTAEATDKLDQAVPDGTPVQFFPVTFEDRQVGLPESSPSDLTFADFGGVWIDAPATAEKAFGYCHDGGFFTWGWRYVRCALGKAPLTPVLTAPHLEEVAPQLAEKLSLSPVDAAYELGENAVAFTVPRNGYTIAPADLTEQIRAALASYEFTVMDCPGTPVAAKTMTAQEVHDAIAGEMKNAGYDRATQSITPEQLGADFDVAAAQALLDQAQPGETVTVPASIETPTVTAERLKAVLFRDVLGSCTTTVKGSAARKNNVRLSSAAINGYVLNSGETFSYNGVVGKRTTAKGYQAAPAYVKGETVDEVGGGVCQPSSTLYLASLRADMKITERYAHRYVPSYIPAGMDATVSWGGPDYKFTNNTDYPVKIVTSYTGGQLTIKLLGTNVNGTSVKITNKHLATIPYEEIIEEDPTMAPGTEKVKTTPYTGHKYETYRNRYDKNGKLISSAFEASSNYKSRNRVIVKGPALPEGQQPDRPVEVIPGGNPQPVPQPNPDPVPVFPDPKPETPAPAPDPAPAPEEPENPGFIIVTPEE